MPQTVTDKDLEKLEDEVNKLRESVAAEREKASINVQEQENILRAAQLNAEKARLAAELAAAKESSRVTAARAGVHPLVQSAVDQMKAAEAQLAATKGEGTPGAPVDPPPPSNDTDAESGTENKE